MAATHSRSSPHQLVGGFKASVSHVPKGGGNNGDGDGEVYGNNNSAGSLVSSAGNFPRVENFGGVRAAVSDHSLNECFQNLVSANFCT